MSRFIVTDLPLTGLKCIKRWRIADSRGSFSRLFCTEDLAAAGWVKSIAQINHTRTVGRGTVRGMHFQWPPHSEMKLVACISGEVWDVAVDVRADSSTFLKWYAERLSAENALALLIPEGFAHGFQALTDDVELLYCHSTVYVPEAEAGLSPLDTALDITWPLPVCGLSNRDAGHPMIDVDFQGINL